MTLNFNKRKEDDSNTFNELNRVLKDEGKAYLRLNTIESNDIDKVDNFHDGLLTIHPVAYYEKLARDAGLDAEVLKEQINDGEYLIHTLKLSKTK